MHVGHYFTAHLSRLNDEQKFSLFANHCMELEFQHIFSRNKSMRVYTRPAGKFVTLISRINTVLKRRIAAILFSNNRYGQPSGCHAFYFNICCDSKDLEI